MTQDVVPLVVGISDAATLLGVSTKTIWRMIGRRDIETVIVARTKKIRTKEIERYLEKNAVPAKEELKKRR